MTIALSVRNVWNEQPIKMMTARIVLRWSILPSNGANAPLRSSLRRSRTFRRIRLDRALGLLRRIRTEGGTRGPWRFILPSRQWKKPDLVRPGSVCRPEGRHHLPEGNTADDNLSQSGRITAGHRQQRVLRKPGRAIEQCVGRHASHVGVFTDCRSSHARSGIAQISRAPSPSA